MPAEPPRKWWAVLHTIALWFTWLGRNGDVIPGTTKIVSAVIMARIWLQLKQHLQIEWAVQTRKVALGKKTKQDAKIDLEFGFGEGRNVFHIVEAKLSFHLLPPELD